MKKLIWLLPILLIACFVACSHAADVPFIWDYGTPMPTGFEMRIMDMSNMVIQTYDCGAAAAKTCTVLNITSGNRQAQCFAYNDGAPDNIREYSNGSNIVAFTVPVKPTVPSNNKVADKQSVSFNINADDEVIRLSFNKELDNK